LGYFLQGDSALLSVGVVVAGAGEEVPSSTLLLMDTVVDEVGALLLAARMEEWTGMTNASDRDAATRRTRAARRRRSGLGVAAEAARRAMVSSWCMMVRGRGRPCAVCGGEQTKERRQMRISSERFRMKRCWACHRHDRHRVGNV
jgi:hypothetical protein